jgi:hemoglobin/transferrin/lactoferrin receptor protein
MRLLLAAAMAGGTAAGSAHAQYVLDLDTITVLATKTSEKAIDSMAGVSIMSNEDAAKLLPSRFSDVLAGMPGVWTQTNADDPGTSISIRGLQDFGRVAVIVDGARQNFQVSEHGGQGKFYFDPELFSQVEVARGPVSNIYGSGAIGGVVSITTKEVEDILVGNDRFGAALKGSIGTEENLLGTAFLAGRPTEDFDFVVGISHRQSGDYADGNGDTVVNTGEETTSELAKLSFRPGEGHEIQLSLVNLNSSFETGDPDYIPTGPGIEYDNDVATTTATAKHTFASPDNPLIDFSASAYWTRTEQEMVVVDQWITGNCAFFCIAWTGPIGSKSSHALETIGTDINNTSRFDGLGLQHTVTIGGDYFDDKVETEGEAYGMSLDDEGWRATPSGDRQVGGAFVQWMAEHGSWLDVIAAIRYDAYHMEGGGHESEGERLSPKLTVGVTPFDGFTVYGTYAEGYRAPALSEAFVSGYHPGAFFKFLQNPDLRPEVGKTYEAGINYKRDGLFADGDAFRLKANAFLNNVEDFIELRDLSTSPDCDYSDCWGYINVSKARIMGFEVETTYDAGAWFLGASGTILDGEDVDTGEALYSVLPAQMMITAGARFFDEKLTIAPNWRYVTGFHDDDPDTDNQDYHLFGLTVAYQPNERTTATLVVDNIFDEYYTPHLQNLPGEGITVKGALEVKLGVE